MASFKVTTSVAAGKLLLKLNGKNVAVDNAQADKTIADGQHFVVQWFVKGVPGSTYAIKITSPASAVIDLKKVIKDTGVDHGGFSFAT